MIGGYTVFLFVFPTIGALYTPDKEREITKRLSGLVSLQKQIEQSLQPDNRSRAAFHALEYSDSLNASDQHIFVSKIIDNLFILKMFQPIAEYMRGDFHKKGLGEPFLSYMNLTEPMKNYVVSRKPDADAELDIRNKGNLIEKVYEMNEGVKHFDQQFKTFIYRLSSQSGLMVMRGNYVILDFDLNGIPDEVYFRGSYKDEKRQYWTYLLPIGSGEDTLAGSTYHYRYTDSLYLVLEYILDYYPVEASPDFKKAPEGSLL
jgi:hypothetical protein